MNKTRLAIGIYSAFLLVNIAWGAAFAQDVPPEYAGLTNPFPWDDAAAIGAGRTVYERSCLGCHGATGSAVPHAALGTADFGEHLEEAPDLHFWILSEGRLELGMPAYRGSLSEEQRWQVLTYIRALSEEAPPTTPPPTATQAGSVTLAAPAQGRSGESLTLTATVTDSLGQPVRNAEVRFFVFVEFFASGPMDIGGAITDQSGVATLQYVPHLSGERQILARYQSAEATTSVTLQDAEQPLYQSEAGIKLPSWGPRVFLGPDSAMGLGAMGEAPTSAFYLPGGLVSWLLLVVAAIVLVWSSYFRVILLLMGIPIARDIRDVDTRLVPRLGLIYVVTLGTILALMLVTGPNSHWHLIH